MGSRVAIVYNDPETSRYGAMNEVIALLGVLDAVHAVDKALNELGYSDVSTSKIVECRIHGITAGYIRDIHSTDFKDISLSKLIEFKIHGVDKKYIDYIKDLMKNKKVTADKIISLKIHGI